MKDFLQVVVFGGAFLVLFLPTVVSDSMYFPFITGKNFYFRIIVEIIFAGWIILALLDTQYRPKLSWVLVSAGALLSVMLFANLGGEYALKSFWSNFERMDGYVTLVHFFLYFVVLGSILSNKQIDFLGMKTTSWTVFFTTALFAAGLVAFYAFQQLAGQQVITQGGWRITGTLGNASYMAVYMLFNTFIALWLINAVKTTWVRVLLGLIALTFVFLLVQTATRGTIVGLAGGLFLGSAYIALFNTQFPVVRKIALGGVVVVAVLVGALFQFKDTAVVQNNVILERAASINLEELTLRTQIWGMALEGVKERPILGWGQGNFNYIFNEHYIPEIYYAELWYDRAHNVFMDWLVAGGILGLIAYLSIFAAATYYIVIRPLIRPDDSFTVVERGLLLGILAGYFTHNLVVFDNIVSFIFFAILLALIHSRIGEKVEKWQNLKTDESVVTHVVAPSVAVLALVVVYLVNVPGMQAAGDIIKAISAPTIEQRLAAFDEALDRGSFARQEVVEQLAQQAIRIVADRNVPNEQKQAFAERAEVELLKLAKDKPNDARVHVFVGGFYRSLGQFDQSAEQAAIARSLSPNKPAIVIEQGITAFQRGRIEESLGFMKEAYDLAPVNPQAQIFYASVLVHAGQAEKVDEVVTEKNWLNFARNNFALSAAEAKGETELLHRMFDARIEADPGNAQHYASQAFIYYRDQQTDKAIEALQAGVAAVPSFAATGQCYIENIEVGKTPQEGC